MTTFNTGNAVPSADARDRFDNSQTFDEVINGGLTFYKNRVGNNVLSFKGMADQFNAAQVDRANRYATDKLARDSIFALDQVERRSAFASMQLDFDNDQAQRLEDFALLMQNTGYEPPVPYTSGLSITRSTQTVTYLGNQYRVKVSSLPLTTSNWATDSSKMALIGDASLRQDLAGPDGSKLSEYKGRSVFDRLAENVYFKDAPFFGKADGVADDSAAMSRFVDYLKANGGRGKLGKGTIYLKTYRIKADMSAGAFKSFVIEGEGSGNTTIKYGNINPVLNGDGTAVVTPEPHLINIFGLSGVTAAPRCGLKGFSIDYSEQVYKGGASASTPALTDIKPLSNGVNMVNASYCDGIDIDDIFGNEIYGNGVILSRSPNFRIKNARGFNVSGGNPGSGDSSGGFIGAMRGSQVGSSIEGCSAINLRTYKTDTVGGFNNITAKDTPCGYIGIWTEYGTVIDGISSPGADLWNTKEPVNRDSFGCSVRGNFIYGYTLGIKSESQTPTFTSDNTVIGCWIPFISGANRGRAVNNYADCANLDGKVCPQSGYEYIRALFVHYNINGQPYDYSGFTFDGSISFTRNTRVFVTNTNNGKFLNQQTVIDHSDNTKQDPQIFTTRLDGIMSGAEVTGTVVIKNLGKAMSSVIYDMKQLVLDLNIINMSNFVYRVSPDTFKPDGGCDFSDFRIRSTGLVGITGRGSRGCRVDYVGVMADPAKSYTTNPVGFDAGCEGSDITVDLTLHSASVPTSQFGVVAIAASNSFADISLTVVDAGSNTLDSVLFTNATNLTIRSVRKFDDVYKTPLIKPGTSGQGFHVANAYSNDRGPLFAANYGLRGPITLGAMLSVGDLTQAAIAYEPNALAQLAKGVINYMQGVRIPYLKPALSGREGIAVYSGGRNEINWLASTAIAVGMYRQTGINVYVCTVAGTTGSVAPSHTSGTAVDGSVTWQYVSPQAKFVEYGSISAAVL